MPEIRPAKYSDIPRIVAVAKEAWARSVYADDPMSVQRFKDDCAAAISSPGMCLLVVDAGTVEGFIVGVTKPIYRYSMNRLATDLMTYVTERGEGAWPSLWRAFEAWADALPATMRVVEIWGGATDAISDSERVGKGYLRMGYDRFGGIYRKRIRPCLES